MERQRFESGETEKVWSEKFDRFFENTTLDKFLGEEQYKRCEDRYGDKGTIVGYHDRIVLDRGTTPPWFWVVRDRDNALIGIQECNLADVRKNRTT